MKARADCLPWPAHGEAKTWVVESSYLLGLAAALQCSARCDTQSRAPGQEGEDSRKSANTAPMPMQSKNPGWVASGDSISIQIRFNSNASTGGLDFLHSETRPLFPRCIRFDWGHAVLAKDQGVVG